jgi:TRAP-type mannitol/chloroaromatic compound transport system substrate-binding protein
LKAWDKTLGDFTKDPLFNEIVESQKAYAKRVMKYLFMNQPDYQMAYRSAFGDPESVKI